MTEDDKILNSFWRYLIDVNTILEIIDKVYAMGKAIAFKLRMKQTEQNGTAKKDANGGNSREHELKKEIKDMRHWIARKSSELSEFSFRRKVWKKASKKEKEISKQLKEQMGNELISNILKIAKE